MIECLRCNTFNDNGARYCKNCGDQIQVIPQSGGKSVSYVGFWIRFVAAFIDGLVLCVPMLILSIMFGVALFANQFNGGNSSSAGGAFVIMRIVYLIFGISYFCLMESSKTQGTLGKMAMGIKVTDLSGNRISFGRALGRYLSKALSYIILLIGYMMAGWTSRKQALHDLIAGTICVRKP